MRVTLRRVLLSAAFIPLSITLVVPASAQPLPGSPAEEAETPAVAEARTRFRRALELVDDGEFDKALAELKRAYELAPNYRVLYNIGLVYQQLHDAANAVDAFERYLADGGADVPAERVEDVRRRIKRLDERLAYLTVTTTEPGVEIAIDDIPMGHTPLDKPLRINSGRRRLTASLPGRPPQSRTMEIAGGQRADAAFDFTVKATPAAPPPKPTDPLPWIGWGVTAALAVTATTFGIRALGAASDYDAQTNGFIDRAQLDSAREKVAHLSLATDLLLTATLVAAGVSVYLTVRHPRPGGTPKQTGRADALWTF